MPRTAPSPAKEDDALVSLGEIPSLTDLAYDHLRRAILSGRLDFGAPVRQEKIAARLGISRHPVREALRRLDSEGLIALKPRRGYYVTSLNRAEIEEVFAIRALLEEHGGYFATLNRTAKDVAELEALLRALDKVVARRPVDLASFGRRNREFHHRLFVTSGRFHLCRVMTVLRDSVERYIRVGATIEPNIEAAQNDHRRILSAFRKGDADAVAALCRRHCEATCERLLRGLESVTE